MNGLGVSLLCLIVGLVLFTSRPWALMSMVAGAIYLPQGLHVEVLGFNLFAFRFVELAGFVRVVFRKELFFSRLNGIDASLGIFSIYTAIVFLLRSSEGQSFEIGRIADTALCYGTFRALVRDIEELRWFLVHFLFLLVPYGVLAVIESVTLVNPFNVFLEGKASGVLREGRLRAAGSFGHPSLLGTLGGSFLPVYLGLWMPRITSLIPVMGLVFCMMLVVAANSGAPVMCVVVALLGWTGWVFRAHMKTIRYAIVASLVLLSLIMKAPLWYLLERVSNLSGGDGYHRAYLIDIAFQNLDRWWVAGMSIADTKEWLPYINTNTGGADMTNQFLVYGVTAGVGAMALFIVVLKRAFGSLGSAIVICRENEEKDKEYLLWGIGVMLLVHVVNWFSIPYFDQSGALWLMELAIVANVTAGCRKRVGGLGSKQKQRILRVATEYS